MKKKSRWGLYRYTEHESRSVPYPYAVFEIVGGGTSSSAWVLLAEGKHEDMHHMLILLLKQAQLEGNRAVDLERSQELYEREKRTKESEHRKHIKEVLNELELGLELGANKC